ncbi:MAG TPA: adenylate/guanylate cyclase domain-containing protein [Rhodocyclaceae bacterium]
MRRFRLPFAAGSRAQRIFYAIALSLLVWLLGLALSLTSFWQQIEYHAFDKLTVLTAPGRSALPITIIGIDEASFAQVGKRWPWPRSLYAKVVDRLVASGAAVIAFDMIFAEASEPKEDQAFADAVQRAGNVVMSADHAYQETALLKQWLRVEPLPLLKRAGAVPGLATVELDSDTEVRQIPQSHDTFWHETINVLQKSRPGLIPDPQVPGNALIRHLGPAHTFPYVSFYQVLNGDPSIPADFFQDQIVLIGRDVRASPDAGAAQADMFATPFLAGTRLLTPGVEIHATIIENAISGQSIVPASRTMTLLLLSFAVLAVLPALVRWHPVWSGVWCLWLGVMVAGGVAWLFSSKNFWLPGVIALSAIATLYLSMALLSYFGERRRGQQIKGAFAKYVSPQVVDQMIAFPDRLKLGGERRELTLLFSDLAGFTSISEKLPPDGVAKVINLYLTEMTQVIMDLGGTVDKFIGDAVMAFWGAPLDDPQHALHGVQAAIAMQQAMARLQPQFHEMGVGEVGLRIGLNTGDAVVGNMGSEDRFDYTALGDTVNLASRLEGVNKMYGTPILLSGATAAKLGGAIALRPVDYVRVKGKAEPVEIFTPCDDATLAELSATAHAAYREMRWDAAEAAWQAVLAHRPDDPVAEVFLERIPHFRKEPPPPGWDGSVALEKG